MSCRSLMAAVTLAVSIASAGAQAPDLAKYPDWSGQWRKFPGQGNQWDLDARFARE